MISTRLTERLGIRHPIVRAPMGSVTGSALAAAVSRAAGLGIVGGAWHERWAGNLILKLSLLWRNLANLALDSSLGLWRVHQRC